MKQQLFDGLINSHTLHNIFVLSDALLHLLELYRTWWIAANIWMVFCDSWTPYLPFVRLHVLCDAKQLLQSPLLYTNGGLPWIRACQSNLRLTEALLCLGSSAWLYVAWALYWAPTVCLSPRSNLILLTRKHACTPLSGAAHAVHDRLALLCVVLCSVCLCDYCGKNIINGITKTDEPWQ